MSKPTAVPPGEDPAKPDKGKQPPPDDDDDEQPGKGVRGRDRFRTVGAGW